MVAIEPKTEITLRNGKKYAIVTATKIINNYHYCLGINIAEKKVTILEISENENGEIFFRESDDPDICRNFLKTDDTKIMEELQQILDSITFTSE